MKKILLFIISICAIILAKAQSPNDLCSNAITLTMGANCEIGNIVTLNTSTGEPTSKPSCHSALSDDGIWYKFTATQSDLTVMVDASGTSAYSRIAVYDGGAAPGNCPASTAVPVYCYQNSICGCCPCDKIPYIDMTGLTIGNTYYVLIDNVQAGAATSTTSPYCVQLLPTASNDACATAYNLVIDDDYKLFSNSVDDSNLTPPTCFDSLVSCGGNDSYNPVWFKFDVPADSTIISVVSNRSGMTYNPNLSLYSGSCGTLTEINCNNGTASSTLITTVLPYQLLNQGTYYILVDGLCFDIGTFQIKVSTDEIDDIWGNDWATNATNAARVFLSDSTCGQKSDFVNDNTTHTTYFVDYNIADDPTPTCWASGSNICAQWFVFTATTTSAELSPMSLTFSGKVIWEDGTLTGGADLAVFTGTPGSLTEFACATNVTVNGGVLPLTGLTAGQDYYVMMDNAGVNANCTYGSLCVKSTVQSTSTARDLCTNAMAITVDTPLIHNSFGMTSDGTLCSGSTENNVWYSITAGATGTYFISFDNMQCNGSRGAQSSIYNSTTCPPSTSTCVQATNYQLVRGIYYEFMMNAGQTYLINLDGFGGIYCQWEVNFTQSRPADAPLVAYKEMQGVKNVFYNKETDELLIQINDPKEELRISLHDITGKQLITVSSNQEQIIIPMSKIPQGMYIVTIDGDNEVYKGKVVK